MLHPLDFKIQLQSPLSITNWLGPKNLFVIWRVRNIESKKIKSI
jgi:hypothetical protein